MQIGIVGLGRMGAHMAERLLKSGHSCVVYNRNPEKVKLLVQKGAKGAGSLKELVGLLQAPRHVWVMITAGDPTEQIIKDLSECLEPGDTIIDGGNSHYTDDLRHAEFLAPKNIKFLDVGTSGGIWGVERGYCLMIGGEPEIVQRLDPIFKSLAPGRGTIPLTPGGDANSTAQEGYLHCGPVGSGHFVKMVHNGIEYGLMQAYAEGFDILRNADKLESHEKSNFNFDLSGISELWRRGSVVSSWLLDLTAMALAENPDLSKYTGYVQDSGEGRWTIQAAVEEAVSAEVLSAALYVRFRSRQEHTFSEKILSAMREKFGGHLERPAGG